MPLGCGTQGSQQWAGAVRRRAAAQPVGGGTNVDAHVGGVLRGNERAGLECPVDGLAGAAPSPDTGQWVTITGTVRSSSEGRLVVDASAVEEIPEPQDPYEY